MADVRISSIPSNLSTTLPVMALRRGVLLPGAVATFNVGRPVSRSALANAVDEHLIIAAQSAAAKSPTPADLLPVGVIARIIKRSPGPRGTEAIVVQGLARVHLADFPSIHPHLCARWKSVEDAMPDTPHASELLAAIRRSVEQTAKALDAEAQVQQMLEQVQSPDMLVDAIAAFITAPQEWKKELLVTTDALARAERVLDQVVQQGEVIKARRDIQERVANSTRNLQREHFLREQKKAIEKELGESEDGDDHLEQLRDRLADVDLPPAVQTAVDREFKRLGRINPQSPERSVAVDWLEWVAELPWNEDSGSDVDLGQLEDALDDSHYGLEDVKRQVSEYLAVRKLAGTGRADVLLLVGPPGVGKTSIGQAIADATDRKLVRIALGGVRDEAELRGHRRTYIGARPGRVVEGLRRAGSADPVILLDEIDKLSNSNMGNPAAALLEILDPEQNHHFVDHYMEVPIDLSRALFVATANDVSSIPRPLRDRMEILEIAGYTPTEKRVIAKRHLLAKVAKNTGLEESDVQLTDGAIDAVIAGWTREAGVRQLQRQLGRVYRAAAVLKAKDSLTETLVVDADDVETYLKRRRFRIEDHDAPTRPGIATGLAWTPVGGDVLYVEASTLPGTGRLVLTGQLGDVMKESARAALTYVLAHSERLGFPTDAFEGKDVHIHVPAGAVPKDGPSAGVTIFTALASLFSGRQVRSDTAMTGEATLRGRVLPVGGIEAKVLAAHRRGLTRVLLPKANGPDLEDVPAEVRDAMDIVLVNSMEEALAHALVAPEAASAVSEAA